MSAANVVASTVARIFGYGLASVATLVATVSAGIAGTFAYTNYCMIKDIKTICSGTTLEDSLRNTYFEVDPNVDWNKVMCSQHVLRDLKVNLLGRRTLLESSVPHGINFTITAGCPLKVHVASASGTYGSFEVTYRRAYVDLVVAKKPNESTCYRRYLRFKF